MSQSEALEDLPGENLREPLRRALTARALVRAPLASGTASAVLIPLFVARGEVRVWLVRRAATLRKHSGQVAFPGGKTDLADESERATALREAHEEIGLPPSAVDVLGRLDDLVTGTGFTISPFVGWVAEPFVPVGNPDEVARVFEVPFSTFFRQPEGVFPFHGHTFDGELVWGATGKILRDLVDVVRALPGAVALTGRPTS